MGRAWFPGLSPGPAAWGAASMGQGMLGPPRLNPGHEPLHADQANSLVER